MAKSSEQIRQDVTDRIVKALKEGKAPWRKPWAKDPNCGFPRNVKSKRLYRGVNPLLLELSAIELNLKSCFWGTFNQWRALGGKIKKRPENCDYWGTKIVFYSKFEKEKPQSDGSKKIDKFWVLRQWTVFNLDQVEGDGKKDCLKKLRPLTDAKSVPLKDAYKEAQNVIDGTGAKIHHGGNKAYYARKNDDIHLPVRKQFASIRDYYDTAFHELSHWAGVEKRANVDTDNYAENELMAEISACYLGAECGLPNCENLENHERYLSHWLKELQNDVKFIFRASRAAGKATNHILSYTRDVEDYDYDSDDGNEDSDS